MALNTQTIHLLFFSCVRGLNLGFPVLLGLDDWLLALVEAPSETPVEAIVAVK